MKIRGNTVGTTLKPENAILMATNLTEAQKAKARENIGAGTSGETGGGSATGERVYFSMAAQAFFEEASNGLYVKSPTSENWFIRGVEHASAVYSSICTGNRSVSPNGLVDCIFIPAGSSLVFDRTSKTFSIMQTSLLNDENVIPVFVTGYTTDNNYYGAVGGIGLHEYHSHVAAQSNKEYNYAKNLEWAVGTLQPGNGKEDNSTSRLRSSFLLVGKGTTLKVLRGYQHLIYSYDLSKQYKSDISWTTADIVIAEDCYVRILIKEEWNANFADATNASDLETVEYIPPVSCMEEPARSMYESTLPVAFETQYATAKETIRRNQLQAGNDGVTFIWLTDLHWNNNFRTSPKIVKHIVKDMGVRNIVLTGDYMGGGDDKSNQLELLRNCMESFGVDNAKTFAIAGNHDYNVHSSGEAYYFTYNETGTLVMGGVDDKVVSGDGCYYYYDMPKNRTRMIFLNTGLDAGRTYITMDDTQKAWLNSALASTPEGYRILVFQHIIYEATSWSAPLLDKLYISTQGEAVMTACDTHNAKGGTQVVAIFGGHIHLDHNTTTAGGIPVIMMDSDSKQTYSGIGVTENTVNAQCVDVVTVDYENEKVSCVRIGRGVDRVINCREE